MQLDDVLVLGGGLSNALEDRGLDLSDGRRGGRRFCSLHRPAKLIVRFLDPPLRQ